MLGLTKQHQYIDWNEIANEVSCDNVIIKEAPLEVKAALIGRVGLMMLSSGNASWHIRDSMNRVGRALDLTGDAVVGLLSIEYTAIDGDEIYTNLLTIPNSGVNTDKLYYMEEFLNDFSDMVNKYSAAQINHILDTISSTKKNYSAAKLGLAAGFACAAFTFLLGGGPVEMLCALFGAGVGNYIRNKLIEKHITLIANLSLGVAAACTTYIALITILEIAFGVSSAHHAGYICAMLFVIPGFPLITSGFDLAKMDIRSGLERLTYAVLIIFMATIVGWVNAILFGFEPSDFVPLSLSTSNLILLRILMSFIGVYGFSMMFNSPRRMAMTAGLIGMITNTMRLELVDSGMLHPALAAFLGTLLAGLIASVVKNKVRFPRITLTVPSMVIMIPGMYMYKGIFFIARDDISTGGLWLTKAVLIVVALMLGLIAARIITDKRFRESV